MKLLSLRTNLYHRMNEDLPFSVYTVGTEHQLSITRLKGYSANQLFITFNGHGIFRNLEHDEWDIIQPNSLLYIPSEYAHEYVPQGIIPWHVGYVSFVDRHHDLLSSWGFGDKPFQLQLQDSTPFHTLLEHIWEHSGPQYDMWRCTEYLFSFCVELKKQALSSHSKEPDLEQPVKLMRHRDYVVDSAVRFLHDHLQRNITMTELTSRVGYSSKQLNRIFQQSLGVTPLQYLQKIRLQAAALLLTDHPDMTVKQVAAHIGMEPVYFTRLFKRLYGRVPVQYRSE